MALVTTTTTAIPAPTTYAIAPGMVEPLTIIPRADIVFRGDVEIPTKAALDDNLWLFNAQLPLAYCYRMCELRLMVDSAQATTIDDWRMGPSVTLQDDDFIDWLDCSNLTYALTASRYQQKPINDGAGSYTLAQAVGSLALITMPTRLFKCGKTGLLNMYWEDDSGDVNVVMNIHYYIRFLQYDIEQLNRAGIHVGTAVLPA